MRLFRQLLPKYCSIPGIFCRTVLREEGQPANVQAWIRQDQSARYSRTVHLGIVVFRVVSDKDHALKNPLKQFSNIFLNSYEFLPKNEHIVSEILHRTESVRCDFRLHRPGFC